jgi:hypothetical protein
MVNRNFKRCNLMIFSFENLHYKIYMGLFIMVYDLMQPPLENYRRFLILHIYFENIN